MPATYMHKIKMVFSLAELLDIVIMSLVIGFIFKDFFMPHRRMTQTARYDPLARYKGQREKKGSILNNGFVLAMVLVAPAIILHEFGHKFVAIAFGLQATFNAAYMWLAIGVLLKLMNFGFIFFVPAYVSIGGAGMTPIMHSAVAFAGPAVNLIMFAVVFLLLKNKAFVKRYRKYLHVFVLTYKINLLLFIFNMLPIPMFDGWHVYSGLIQTFL